MEPPHLFARLYLDEDVHVRIVDIVRGRGYRACTTRDEGMLGRSDAEQLAFAAEQEMMLVTHNRTDFEKLARRYFEEERTHAGIICAFRRSPYECALRLISLLNSRTAEEFKDQLLYT
ncbi:DUF5615 family PIN-like protein [Salisaeta longa]|uniref:DUF5615 family PIN-like protein n=1 Tax=Salisaeta longa TaxID=503170 RepID=UPI0003B4B137|nr:DUF5615 family PIN-like protein [Salisaeta longa]